jgi:hypothetical protein
MLVFQTAGEPPSRGRTIFVNIGWTENRSAALSSRVVMKIRSMGAIRMRVGIEKRLMQEFRTKYHV